MGRWVDTDDLVTASQVADRIGSSTALVLTWKKRYSDMPAPVVHLNSRGQTPVWLWSELAPWLVAAGVLSNRHNVPMTGDPSDELLSGKEIAELLGWREAGTAWKLVQHGTFPRPVREDRPRLWRREEVEEWARTRPRRPRRRGQPGEVPTDRQ